jgi:hypothetical protein
MKEQFYNLLTEEMSYRHFLQQDTEKIWIKEFQVQGQGVVMNINGQQFQQPGEVIKMMYKLEVLGDGSIDEIPFSQINFQVKQGDDLVVDIEECIYYDEIEIVRNIINQIYR